MGGWAGNRDGTGVQAAGGTAPVVNRWMLWAGAATMGGLTQLASGGAAAAPQVSGKLKLVKDYSSWGPAPPAHGCWVCGCWHHR